jgi:RimJ/RimL family protein N-acetyltransferase
MNPHPERVVLEGRYVRLEPLAQKHSGDLWHAASAPGEAERFRYLSDAPPHSEEDMSHWVSQKSRSEDPLFFAVLDAQSSVACGRQALMRVVPEHGVIEVGCIYWGPRMARTRLATEALFVTARYVFETLGYRRFEWKCNALNEASRHAALRFGFSYEGIFRKHMVIKGQSRDTAWFSMVDDEWPTRKAEFERWLDPGNFDSNGSQRTKLHCSALSPRA